MKTDHSFHSYFLRSQHFSFSAMERPRARTALLELIDDARHQHPEYDKFLQGEKAFYAGSYSVALKNYLQSKTLPYYKLFCYRASAYASHEAGELGKAQEFVQKALGIYSEDYPSLLLLDKLLQNSRCEDCSLESYFLKVLEDQRLLIDVCTTEDSVTFSHPEIFMSFDNRGDPSNQQLMHRLYKRTNYAEFFIKTPLKASCNKSIIVSSISSLSSLNHIKKIAKPFLGSTFMTTITQPAATAVAIEEKICNAIDEKLCSATENTLTESINTFRQHQEDAMAEYRASFSTRTQPFDNILYALHGWRPEFYNDQSLSLTTRSRSTTGGFFIRWGGKGIVINPGRNFLDNFHKQGLHIWDIHAIIVTSDHYDAYADIQELYALNSKLNKNNQEVHVIHYYLAQKAYQSLAPHLKPHFKQERHSLHCLELFIDSPDAEKLEINENIVLNYFPLTASELVSSEGKTLPMHSALGIKLEFLHDSNGTQDCKLGYISGAAWTPMISKRLGSCDLLIAGFGSTQSCDYQKQKHPEGCLGYFGTSSLLSEVAPRLLLCGEFSGTEGDIRLEVVKLLRQQNSQASHGQKQAIQPLDLGMLVNLKRLQIQCSVTKSWVDANQIRVARTRESFGSLNYLSPSCWS